MNTQEFYSSFLVFTSLILAAAVTEILSSLGTYIRNYKYIKSSLFISGWSILTLLAMIQYWYALVIFSKTRLTYSFDSYLIDIASAIFFYLLSRIILPDFSSYEVTKTIDSARKNGTSKYRLDCYFYQNVLFIYGMAAILIIISDVTDRFYTTWNDNTEMYRSSFRLGFLTAVCTGWIVSFFEKRYPNEKQKKLVYTERRLVGLGHKINTFIWAVLLILFLWFISKFFPVTPANFRML